MALKGRGEGKKAAKTPDKKKERGVSQLTAWPGLRTFRPLVGKKREGRGEVYAHIH